MSQRAVTRAAAPLEKHLVDAIRHAFKRMGLVTWSGRIWVRGHRPPYLPVLGPGTPDILGVTRQGRLFGVEAKRDDASHDRPSQEAWRAYAAATRIAVVTVRSVGEAVAFVRAL